MGDGSPHIGPVILSVVGDTFTKPCRIQAWTWEGQTTAGDTFEVTCPITNSKLFKGRAGKAHDYISPNLGMNGIHAPYGFKLTQKSSGEIHVYLNEN